MIKKIASLKGQVDCSNCFSLLEWDSIEDIKWVTGNKYIICPECGNNVILHDGVDYWKEASAANPSNGNYIEVEWTTAVDAQDVTFDYYDGTGPSGMEQLAQYVNCVSGFSFDTHGGDYDPLIRLTVNGSPKKIVFIGQTILDSDLDRGYNVSLSSSIYDESTDSWIETTAYYVQIMSLTG